MKIGDKVKIKDGSYMTTIINSVIAHCGSHESTKIIGWCQDTFTIVTIGGEYPTDDKNHSATRKNNIILRNDANGEIWFCSFINIYKLLPRYTMKELRKIVGHDFELNLEYN